MYLSKNLRSNLSSKGSSGSSKKKPLALDPERALFHLEEDFGGSPGSLRLNRKGKHPLDIQSSAFKRIVPQDDNLKGLSVQLFEMDQVMLEDVYKGQLQKDEFVEFNNYMTLTNAGAQQEQKYSLVNSSAPAWKEKLTVLTNANRRASHLYNLMLTIVPAVASNTPGNITLSFHDDRMEEGASMLFGIRQKVTQPRVYLISTGYSVPLNEFDFKIKLKVEGVPIKKGKTAVWARLGWNLAVHEHPVYIPLVPALASDIEAGELPMQKLAITNMLAESSGMRRTSFSVEDASQPSFGIDRFLADQANTLSIISSGNDSDHKSENSTPQQPELSFIGPLPKVSTPITQA
ncbi:Movement protein [Privet leaf blotch-associated virus]|uniref:Movement protein n=1 Tax=Privet leaf blotch-associated virus TaxID=1811408 RepID=A0A1E1JQ53_9VIRU|nr:Movement protein [Privet leaf blotch-associated virus]CZS63541.1 Movement protein [Privet leaf blotch-associated virus]